LRNGSAAVIAAVLSFGALPTIAHADDGNGRRHGRDNANTQERSYSEGRQQRQVVQRQQRAAQQPQRQASQPQRTYQAPVAQERSGRDWNRGDRRSETANTRSGRDWNRGDRARSQPAPTWNRDSERQAQITAQARERAQVTARTQAGRWERNRTYSDNTRNHTYRDSNRSDWRQDRQQAQNAYRSGYRDGNRTSYRDRDRDHRSWNHDWRRDNRYNWYSYRNANRNIFHIGRYYSPYNNYRYNRLSIGFRLGSLFYGSRYWINDPWQYRLPEAYGPYRWVRYYDDALLVDTYSGEVVDVIYDFFW
jgi:hypothetical protein